MIPRDNLIVTDDTTVCERHFTASSIVRVDNATRPVDGSVLCVIFKHVKFLNSRLTRPSFGSEQPVSKRKTPENRRDEIDSRDLFEDCMQMVE